MTRGASRHQHDTLDQIREHLEAIHIRLAGYAGEDNIQGRTHRDAVAALAKFDALIAEGRIVNYGDIAVRPADQVRGLFIPLLVGVGCGNAKKDTP